MRVLYTVHQFLPDYFAGTETLTYNTACEMRRRGHDVHIFTGGVSKNDVYDNFFNDYEYDGFQVSQYMYARDGHHISQNRIKADYHNPLVASYFIRKMEEIQPDVVHFYHLQRLSTSIKGEPIW